MTDKQPSYRDNLKKPKPNSELERKRNELFERHREIGTLRHWLMALAAEAAQEELGITPVPPSAKSRPAPAPVKSKKVESFAGLLPDSDDGEPVPRKAKSKELEACESIEDEIENIGEDSEDWDEFFEKHKPLRLSDM